MTALSIPALIAAGCSGQTSDIAYTEDDRIIVDFWYALGGSAGEAVEAMADDFNESQDDIYVQANYQGSYEEALTQIRQLAGTPDAPALMQVFEVGTRYMIDSGFAEPMQTFIDEDGFDVSTLEENILSYYQYEDELYSMPFNTSNALMFYNKDLFEEAGLDPEDPPQTFSEVQEYAEQLTDGDTYGFSLLIYGWFIEQLLANQGAELVNEENGRAGDPSETFINGEEGLAIYTWIEEMIADGTLGNFGRTWDDIRAAFIAEDVAMYLDSTAATYDNITSPDFEVGTAAIPHPDGQDPEGVIVGGASVWMMADIPEEIQEAAWEFVKYTVQPDVQAEWSAATGYFPVHTDAYNEPVLEELYGEFPQFLTSVEQLQNTTPSPATQGALMDAFPEVREQIMISLERMHEGMSAEDALNELESEINAIIN